MTKVNLNKFLDRNLFGKPGLPGFAKTATGFTEDRLSRLSWLLS